VLQWKYGKQWVSLEQVKMNLFCLYTRVGMFLFRNQDFQGKVGEEQLWLFFSKHG
jgi:hypothetical protein